MKKFRKLIPALCMLLVSALFVGTSTYAWFSMNDTVTATNMQVKAKSDAIFLQIKGEADEAYGTTGKTNSMADVALFPVSHTQKTINENKFGVETITKDNVAKNSSWWYGYSNNADQSTLVDLTAKSLTDNDSFNDYVVKKTFNVNIAATSGLATAKDLKVSSVTFGTGEGTDKINLGVRIVIVGADNLVEFNATDADGDDTVITNSIPKDNSSTEVSVYIYIDGEHTSTKSADAEKLMGTIEFSLTCTAAEAGN